MTYAEGCPDVSPDGRRLLYPGHTAEGRAFAFVSDRPDGGDGVPVVATAEPSQASEPTWLSDGQSFSYDIDTRHMGIYSLVTKRSSVLPEPTTAPHASANRYVSADHIFTSAWLDASTTEISGFEFPSLRERFRFHLSELLVDWRPVNEKTVYLHDDQLPDPLADLRAGPRAKAGPPRRIHPRPVRRSPGDHPGRSAVRQLARPLESSRRWPDGNQTELLRDGLVFGGDRCGNDLLLSEKAGNGIGIIRVDAHGAPCSPG